MWRTLFLAGAILSIPCAHAAEIGVVGLFPGKAVLVVDGAAPKTYAIGSSIGDGARLVAVTDAAATFEINGKRQTIMLGDHINRAGPGAQSSVTLQADGQGHFVAQGQINGGTVRMLLDTGATSIALPATDAVRLGIDYRRGRPVMVNTANGTAAAYQIKLDTVRIGGITLNQVDAIVIENGLQIALLGMSFLNRTDMRREGQQMVLTKRF